jgi:hypothetical protein
MPRKTTSPRPSAPPSVPDDDPFNNLRGRIHTIRGAQVMLDEDLAILYGVEIRALNQAIKRNKERFPAEFCFQMTQDETSRLRSQFVILDVTKNASFDHEVMEASRLRSQIVTLENGRGKYRKYLPYAFTEQGVAMLSAVLRSETAVKVSIRIMQAFVDMRRTLHTHAGVFQRIEGLEHRIVTHENDTARKFEEVFNALGNPDTPPKQGLYFDGQVYDAHALISQIIRQAKRSITIIDNYVDDTVLTMLAKRRKGVAVDIHSRSISPELKLDVAKHNAQYPTVTAHVFKASHDRFLILDGDTVYHLGASLKDAGKKWFGFSRFDASAFRLLDKLKRPTSP